MTDQSKITLTVEEICVIASLLQYRTVFLPSIESLHSQYTDLQDRVHQAMHELERRMIVFQEPGGTMYVDAQAKQAISCLCEPDTAGAFRWNTRSGYDPALFLFRRGSVLMEAMRLWNGKYTIHPLPEWSSKEQLKMMFINTHYVPLHISLPLKTAVQIHSETDAFNSAEAEKLAAPFVKDDAQNKILMQALSGSSRFLKIRGWKRNGRIYQNNLNDMLVRCTDQVVKLRPDAAEMLHIEAVSQDEIQAEIAASFEIRGS